MYRIGRSLTAATVLVSTVLMGVVAGAAGVAAQDARTPQSICDEATQTVTEPATRQFEQAADVLQAGVDYWAVLCTDAGPIYVDLFEDQTPVTVNNFVFLAQQGYYNNTTFHRVLPGFMAQAGDPTGTGSGGPGYSFEDEVDTGLTFDQSGLLAMANAGANTNGSQFFITYVPTTWLNGNHTIFGQVAQGLPVAELLTRRDPDESPPYPGSTLQTVVIVEDPESVDFTPDAAPDIAHIQAVLENNVPPQLSEQFVLVDEYSHTYDLQAEAASWQEDGGQELVDYMQDYLAAHGFLGTAALLFTLDQCQAEMPIWGLGMQVSDYGTVGEADVVVNDNARSDELVATGAYDSYSDVPSLGRVYQKAVPAEDWCGPNGVYYRVEVPTGRYVLAIDLVVDNLVIGPETQPTANEYLAFLAQDFVGQALSGVLYRGNAATTGE